jgi:hypothetical protein
MIQLLDLFELTSQHNSNAEGLGIKETVDGTRQAHRHDDNHYKDGGEGG